MLQCALFLCLAGIATAGPAYRRTSEDIGTSKIATVSLNNLVVSVDKCKYKLDKEIKLDLIEGSEWLPAPTISKSKRSMPTPPEKVSVSDTKLTLGYPAGKTLKLEGSSSQDLVLTTMQAMPPPPVLQAPTMKTSKRAAGPKEMQLEKISISIKEPYAKSTYGIFIPVTLNRVAECEMNEEVVAKITLLDVGMDAKYDPITGSSSFGYQLWYNKEASDRFISLTPSY